MLTVDELRSIDAGHVMSAEYLAERSADFDRCAAIDAPDLRQRFLSTSETDHDNDHLVGLPLTSGIVQGIALVLHEPSADHPASLDGHDASDIVLIARSVDAGWVPLFGEVAGVAVDIGGDLSHGSIISRELGLPAITNTRRGTSAFVTGDHVRLDARSGTLDRL